MISVVMSTYNEQPGELDLAIKSILNQTYQDFEFIIVDDNPTNEMLWEELQKYKNNEKIRLIHNEINMGLAKSLNKAIEIAQGYYIARMDADDISLPNRLATEVSFLEKHSLDMVYGCITRMNENGEDYPEASQDRVYTSLDVSQGLVFGCTISHPTVLIKTSVLKEMNGYRDLVPAEDYDLWLRMVSHGKKIGCVGERVLRYRVRSNSLSRSNQFKQFLTSRYVKGLYQERKQSGGTDSYSVDHMQKYLIQHGVANENIEKRYIKARQYYHTSATELKKRHVVAGVVNIFKTILSSRYGLEMVHNTVRARKLR